MDINWANVFDVSSLLKCFIVAGIICVIGQILIDKTKLTPARILVIFVTTGAVLGGLGIYKYLVEFAGCGATVPLTGFGYNLAKGAKEAVEQYGFVDLTEVFQTGTVAGDLNAGLENYNDIEDPDSIIDKADDVFALYRQVDQIRSTDSNVADGSGKIAE